MSFSLFKVHESCALNGCLFSLLKFLPVIHHKNIILSQIWEVGKAMWNSNLSEVFRLIDTYEWSEHESDVMKALKETVRERSFELIGRAYTSISVSEFSKYIGMTEEDAVSMALKEPGWTVNHQEKLICPVRRQQTELTTVQAEQQLTTLTNFVSFLEK